MWTVFMPATLCHGAMDKASPDLDIRQAFISNADLERALDPPSLSLLLSLDPYLF